VERKNWAGEEINRFEEALRRYGRDFDQICQFVGSKSRRQVVNRFNNVKSLRKKDFTLEGSLFDCSGESSRMKKYDTHRFDGAVKRFGQDIK